MMRRATLATFLAAACLAVVPCAAMAQAALPVQATSAGNAAHGQPLAWASLSPGQQQMLAPLQGQWDQMKPGRQQRLAQNATRWASLPPARQQQIRDRLTQWARMTPEQRHQLRENARAFQDLTPEERARVGAAFHKFQSLPPAERRALRERWQQMTPAQRQHWTGERAGRADHPAPPPSSH